MLDAGRTRAFLSPIRCIGNAIAFRINGHFAGAYADIELKQDDGTFGLTGDLLDLGVWAYGGPGKLRNVEIREIFGLPPEFNSLRP